VLPTDAPPEQRKPSLGDIARLAGVSPAAVTLALQNKPRVSPATRARILGIARDLGYSPDPRIASWMARVRDAKSKDLLPIAWLNTAAEEDAWQRYRFQSPYLEGARQRALQLGYRIEEIWCAQEGMTMRRLARILYQRGIEGAIVTFPALHLRLNWDHLASVALGGSLLAPRLHRITADVGFNLLLALKHLKRLGYRRIGVCLQRNTGRASYDNVRAIARDFYLSAAEAERIPPLFHPPQGVRHLDYQDENEPATVAWLKRYEPDAIIGYDNRLEKWAKTAGFRVPEDVGLVHLAVDDDVLDWAGVHSRRHKIGATAAEWLVSLMQRRQFGVPETPLNILIEGAWQTGRTLGPAPMATRQPLIFRPPRQTKTPAVRPKARMG
jgi:LacI family transcriptional regulator